MSIFSFFKKKEKKNDSDYHNGMNVAYTSTSQTDETQVYKYHNGAERNECDVCYVNSVEIGLGSIAICDNTAYTLLECDAFEYNSEDNNWYAKFCDRTTELSELLKEIEVNIVNLEKRFSVSDFDFFDNFNGFNGLETSDEIVERTVQQRKSDEETLLYIQKKFGIYDAMEMISQKLTEYRKANPSSEKARVCADSIVFDNDTNTIDIRIYETKNPAEFGTVGVCLDPVRDEPSDEKKKLSAKIMLERKRIKATDSEISLLPKEVCVVESYATAFKKKSKN